VSVSERKNASPTAEAKVLTFFVKVASGVLTFTFPFSMAVLNLSPDMEFSDISSLTIGTVYCSSLIEKGSRPAMMADVSRTMIFCCVLSVKVFTSFP
jgi:hypothetical protein